MHWWSGAMRRLLKPGAQSSLRSHLLFWVLGVVLLFTLIETVWLYRNARDGLNVAHDRLLRATAQAIGDSMHVDGGRLQVNIPFALIEAYDTGQGSQMAYRVTDFRGELLAGDANLQKWTQPPVPGSLISFHDVAVNLNQANVPMRMVVLHQPVEGSEGRDIALIQIAETLQVREQAAWQLLNSTLLRQLVLMICIAVLIVWIVNRSTRPLRAMRQELLARDANSLQALQEAGTKETQPLLEAINHLLARLTQAQVQQQRFIADAAHQLRTPLAVLKVQLQSALAGHLPVEQAWAEMQSTVNRSAELTDQLLLLAKVEQMRQRETLMTIRLDDICKQAALELSPLMTQKALAFELYAQPVQVQATPWLLGELIRNLLANAIRHSPAGGSLVMEVSEVSGQAHFLIQDSGQGIDPEVLPHVFKPFTDVSTGIGLGLAIAKGIAEALGAKIELTNRLVAGERCGLDARLIFPKAMV
jgi:two-component system, OmpR family, sensor histidine kinase TctE